MNLYISAKWLEERVHNVTLANGALHGCVDKLDIYNAPSIDICFCEECMYADEEPIADGRYWCALHQCFMRFCSDGKEESRR